MTQTKHIYLIDGNAYIHRAYHAITPLFTKNGLPTHAVFGFNNIIARVLREKEPEYLAIAFDAKGTNFRHDMYPNYKANRTTMPDDLVVQIPYIKELVQANNILSIEMSGVEADDLIAAAAKLLSEQGYQVTIVSGDKDLLQLVSDRVTIWEPMNDKIMDQAAVLAKYKVPALKLNDLFALIGDSSDNIPGVPGIGPKTAEMLINEFGSLEGIFAEIEKVKRDKLRHNLLNHKEEAFLSQRLIALKTDIEVPGEAIDYLRKEPNAEKLTDLYTTLEFSKLLKESRPSISFDTDSFILLQSEEDLNNLSNALTEATFLAVDTETTSLDPLCAELVGVSLSWTPTAAYYLPISHHDAQGRLCEHQFTLERALSFLRPFLEDHDLPKLGHNLKYDLAIFANQGLNVQGPLWDTMIASYLLDANKRSHKLDTICLEQGYTMTSFQEVTHNAKNDDCFRYVPLVEAKNYACEDVAAVLMLWERFQPLLEENNLLRLFEEVEIPMIRVLAEMEKNGITVDKALLHDLSSEFAQKIRVLDETIYGLAGREFNINSPKQLAEILFEELGLPHGRKTKTGYSTDSKVLEKLALSYDLPKTIIEHRTLTKLKTTYIDKLPHLIHPKTGRIHSSFNQTVTATGRLSSSEPNLQNIPIRSSDGQRIREAFIPAANHFFIAADYSQIDLRVLAHYSQDEALLAAFRSGADIHGQTAAEIFRIHPSLVTNQMRRIAKSINFGIIYGMSAFGLAGQLKISRKEAATFIERYLEHFHGVKQFMEDIVLQAKNDGYITTLMGRKRYLPDINSSNKTRREFAERTALNSPIQGTAADIIKVASLAVDKRLSSENLQAKLILQIHDELVLETPESEVDVTKNLLKNTMENCFSLDVPLLVNISTGNNLAKT